MSDKERRTVTLSPDANRTLEQEDNASAVVNDLVEQYARTGDRGAAGLKLRRKHKLNELEEARERVSRLESEVVEPAGAQFELWSAPAPLVSLIES